MPVSLGTGYPGTPSTEIWRPSPLWGPAQWAPNEKVALEVGWRRLRGRALHRHYEACRPERGGRPLFTAAYTGVSGGLVIVSADDPGMASSQNEQDNRRYAVAAASPCWSPADAQEAYDYTRLALELSERWRIPLLCG